MEDVQNMTFQNMSRVSHQILLSTISGAISNLGLVHAKKFNVTVNQPDIQRQDKI